jgi:hypothetical protein
MVIVPARAAPALAAALKPTEPFPLPDDPDVTVIQSVLFDIAVHAHVAAFAETATVPDPPAGSTAWLAGAIEYAHGTAACEIVNAWPPTVIVLVRAAPPFAATLNVTVPSPVPEPPLAIEIHDAPADAVQLHQLEVVTLKLPEPPALSTDRPEGKMAYVQPVAACVTVNVCPAIVAVPPRGGPALAATLNPRLPLPVADGTLVNVIQLAFDVAVHAHAPAVVTAIVPVAPPAWAE